MDEYENLWKRERDNDEARYNRAKAKLAVFVFGFIAFVAALMVGCSIVLTEVTLWQKYRYEVKIQPVPEREQPHRIIIGEKTD